MPTPRKPAATSAATSTAKSTVKAVAKPAAKSAAKSAVKPAAKPAPTVTAAPKPSTGDVFRKPKEDKRAALTSERIADDLAAFQRTGGKIEVLGTTRTLKSIPPPDATPAEAKQKTSSTKTG